MSRGPLLQRLERAWQAFNESYAGVSETELLEPGVTGAWSVKDIIAHVTWWEEEALRHLPLILTGGTPPRYSVTYGGIDAFNAIMTKQRKDWPLVEVLRHGDETHRRLITLIESVPVEQTTSDTRFRRRLRLDTYGHYPKHARAIRAWREHRALATELGERHVHPPHCGCGCHDADGAGPAGQGPAGISPAGVRG